MVLKMIIHGQMTEKISFEVRPKMGQKMQKVLFLKSVFWPFCPLEGQKKLYHIKLKSKISYLGEKISILPRQMAEQWAVEVDVKKCYTVVVVDKLIILFLLFLFFVGDYL